MTDITSKSNPLLIILVSSFIVLVIMQPWNLYFLNDDFEHIPKIGETLIVRKNFLRPLANLFLLFDKYLYAKWAPGYFLTTWFLHTGCAISVYWLCREVIKQYVPKIRAHAALLTALFFLFYPFHAEPLFWIIARGSIIASLFAILSLYYYLKKDKNVKYLIVSLLLFIIALLTYENVWNVLFFYCLISFVNIKQHRSVNKTEYLHTAIFVLTFIAYIIVRYLSLNNLTGDYAEINNNLINIPLLLTNLTKLVGRNFTPPFYNTVLSVIFFSLSVITYGLAIVFMFKKNKAAGWLMIILWLGVISGVITATPLGIDTHGNESERYIYYSSFFFCFFLAIAIALLHKEWQYVITSFIIISCITGLIIYNANYRYAAAITKTTLEFVKKYPDGKNAFFIDVPGEYKGALIFRVCLPDAINWIASESKFDTVTIISRTEEASGILPYQTGEKTWEQLSREKSGAIQSNVYSLKGTLNRNIILNKNDIVFWFTKKGLYKVNRP